MKAEYVCHSGGDLLVANAARASFGKEKKELDDKDIKLIHFLAREKHVLPFRHPSLTLRCQAPIWAARQLGKHQVGFSWSEESRRYVKTEPTFYWPDKWRKAAENVKQGSSDEEAELSYSTNTALGDYRMDCAYLYEKLLEDGVAPEQARMVLPQNMNTTWVWTGTLLAWMQMIKLRLEKHTQKETRDFAQMVEAVVKEHFPHSYEALSA